MESRCSLIRGNVTDKTWASRYTSSPSTQQLLLPDFIVSLVHKSQLPRGARPRRPAPTIIKIELSLIESSRFSREQFFSRLCACLCEWSRCTYTTFWSFFFASSSPFRFASSFFSPAVSAAPKRYKRQTHNDLNLLIPGNHTSPWIAFLSDKKYISLPRKLPVYNCCWKGKLICMLLHPFCAQKTFVQRISSL